jgi:alpha-tubulin suppressor-like RCC1 family protein
MKKAYVWGFGKNKSGELSLGIIRDSLMPQPCKNVGDRVVKHISSGGSHTGLVSVDGELLTCGSYLHGKLGIDSYNDLTKFTLCSNMKDKQVKKVACGEFHTVCLLNDGSVHNWGGSLHNKLGSK